MFRGESKNPNGTRFKIVLEVKKEPDTKLAQTELNLAFYERTLYYLSPISKALREYASEKVGYVKNLLQKPEYGYTVTDSDLTKANGLVNALLRRMEGLIPKLVGLAPLGLVKVGAFTIILSLIAYYMFILQDTQLAIGIILSILFYLAFQLPSAVRRK